MHSCVLMRPPRFGRPSLRGRGVGTEVLIARSSVRAQARHPEREGVVRLGLRATYAGCPTNPPPKVARLLGALASLKTVAGITPAARAGPKMAARNTGRRPKHGVSQHPPLHMHMHVCVHVCVSAAAFPGSPLAQPRKTRPHHNLSPRLFPRLSPRLPPQPAPAPYLPILHILSLMLSS